MLPTVQESNESFSESPQSMSKCPSTRRNLKGANPVLDLQQGVNSVPRKNSKMKATSEPKQINKSIESGKKHSRKLSESKSLKKVAQGCKKDKKSGVLEKGKENKTKGKEMEARRKSKDGEKSRSKSKRRRRFSGMRSGPVSVKKDWNNEDSKECSSSEYLNRLKLFTEFNRITQDSLRAIRLKQKEIFSCLKSPS